MEIKKDAQISFEIPRDLKRQLKIKIAQDGISMRALLVDFIEDYISKKKDSAVTKCQIAAKGEVCLG